MLFVKSDMVTQFQTPDTSREAGKNVMSTQIREYSSASPLFERNAAVTTQLCYNHSGSRMKRVSLTESKADLPTRVNATGGYVQGLKRTGTPVWRRDGWTGSRGTSAGTLACLNSHCGKRSQLFLGKNGCPNITLFFQLLP